MEAETVDNQGVNTEQTKPAEAPKSAKKGMSLKAIIAIVVVILVGLGVSIFLFINSATSAPLKASNQLISYIQTKNASGAYSMFSSAAKVDVTQDKVTAVVDQIAPILTGTPKVQSKEVNSESGSNATAKIVYKIKGTDATYNVTVDLVKENGEWKVKIFDSKQE